MTDEIDKKIISELLSDGRKSFRTISKKIGISTQSVITRYNKLIENKTIQHVSISINLKKIGYEGTARLLITTSPGSNLSKTMNEIRGINNVITATKAIGDFEGYAVIPFRNIEDLNKKVLEIRKMENIEKVEVAITTPGYENFPPLQTPNNLFK